MPFDAKSFYDLAIWLVNQKPDESSLRTAIGRVYFAGHLLAMQKLVYKGWVPKGSGEDHGGVIRELRKGKTTGLSVRLNHLRMLREHADYHLGSGAEDCELCQKSRQSSPASDQEVTTDHWSDAKETGERCLPLIEKL